MNITIFGANGNVGTLVVRRALHQGHHMHAFVHSPGPFKPHPQLEVSAGDVEAVTLVAATDLAWTAVRAPTITPEGPVGYQLTEQMPSLVGKVAGPAVAASLVDLAERPAAASSVLGVHPATEPSHYALAGMRRRPAEGLATACCPHEGRLVSPMLPQPDHGRQPLALQWREAGGLFGALCSITVPESRRKEPRVM